MKRNQRIVSLTIFLLRDGIRDSEVIDLELRKEVRSFPVTIEDKEAGTLYVKQTPAHPPAWAKLFDGSVDLRSKDLKNSSVSAIYLTRAGGRLFALAFGQGRHLLSPNVFEDRFGLKVTLNSVDPDLLRAVDVTTLEANPFHGKRQAARAAPLGEFGLNLDQDILRAVTGKPLDESLGTQMTGTDSLSVRVRADLSGLKRLLTKYLSKSQEDTYKKRGFAWVDHVAEVRDQKLCETLYKQIIDSMDGAESSHVWAAIPEVVDWTSFDHFRYGTPGAENEYDDITIERMIDSLDGQVPSIELLKKKRIYCISNGNPHPVMEWTFLKCLTADLHLNGMMYILNAGVWYRIDIDYARQVDLDISTIIGSALPITDWGDENEAAYNDRMHRRSAGQLALMDKVMVAHSGMVSPIEFCDLYSLDRQIIHVKRYGQSSVLSHLFAQGLVSATSLLSDPEFRKVANSKLPLSHRFQNPEERISAASYEICFAIGSSQCGALKLPFFSRVTLRNVYRVLTVSYNFRASLSKITVSKLTSRAA